LVKNYPFADFDGAGSEADQNKQENSEESKEENPTPDDLWGNKEGEYWAYLYFFDTDEVKEAVSMKKSYHPEDDSVYYTLSDDIWEGAIGVYAFSSPHAYVSYPLDSEAYFSADRSFFFGTTLLLTDREPCEHDHGAFLYMEEALDEAVISAPRLGFSINSNAGGPGYNEVDLSNLRYEDCTSPSSDVYEYRFYVDDQFVFSVNCCVSLTSDELEQIKNSIIAVK
jgi:hypothetical protein